MAQDDKPLKWRVQHTMPITYSDLDTFAIDLRNPENLPYNVEYDEKLDMYIIGNKIDGVYIQAPIMMTPKEYMEWENEKG